MTNKNKDPKTEGWEAAVEDAVDVYGEDAGPWILCAYIRAHHPLVFDEAEAKVGSFYGSVYGGGDVFDDYDRCVRAVDYIMSSAEKSAEIVRVSQVEAAKPAVMAGDLYQVLVDKLGGMTTTESCLARDIYENTDRPDVFGIERDVIDTALGKARHRNYIGEAVKDFIASAPQPEPAVTPIHEEEVEMGGREPQVQAYGSTWPAHRVDERVAKFIKDNREVKAAIHFMAKPSMVAAWGKQFMGPGDMKQRAPFLKAVLDVAFDGELDDDGSVAWSIKLAGAAAH